MAPPGPAEGAGAPPSTAAGSRGLCWAVFCRVIDNFGDIGVCWRLAADLADRGHSVHLWTDDPSALRWMAPGAIEGNWPGIRVLRWDATGTAAGGQRETVDVVVEAFGCEIDDNHLAALFPPPEPDGEDAPRSPVWINLEYLSAEPWVQRCHRLPSPVQRGPARGRQKIFFFPGFRAGTGGLLREPDLPARHSRFDRVQWRKRRGLPDAASWTVGLFCYEPGPLASWLEQLRRGPVPVHLLVAAGRPAAAVRAAESAFFDKSAHYPSQNGHSSLSFSYLPLLTQREFDHLLWSCDLNFVRGEDSLVRALWAGEALIWHIYPQHDHAHHAKLEAFLDWLEAPESLRVFHRIWNGVHPGTLPPPDLPAWRACVQDARRRLLLQDDLTTQLLRLVMEKR